MTRRRIDSDSFMRDVRVGVSDMELRHKYGLDADGLAQAFDKMLEIGAMTQSEMFDRIGSILTASEVTNLRRAPRHYLVFKIPVVDLDRPTEKGFVNDITEEGLQISGINSEEGEIRTLMLRPDEVVDVGPITFKALTRWKKLESGGGQPVAGFRIVSLSQSDLERIRRLISLLSLE